MASSVGFGDTTVHFLSDGGVITDQFNMRVLSIREEHECGSVERITIEGFVRREDSSPRSYGATGLLEKAVKVIYNPPATIAFWADGSKAVVKCDKDDVYDPKYGLALCYMKKALGSSRAFNDALRAGRNCNNAAMDFLTKHKISEYMLSGPHKDIFKNICPVEGVPCRSCPYVLLPEYECVKKIRDDIKTMREGEKHD